ncbi:MAG: hypothetical protein JOY99_01355 [Sphingomonadaceae bacterium]|nr:hypothetical protein [Sphingomonadaceae bacterium]
MPDLLLAFTSPKPGREEEYIDWYRTRHVADIVAVPGILNGQFFRLAVPREAQWRFALLYEIETAQGPAALAEIQTRMGGPSMPASEALDGIDGVFGLPLGEWQAAPGRTAEDRRRARYRLIALARPLAGREEEYVRWYGEQHVGDVLRIPGMVGAQRYRLAPTGATPDLPWRHLAVYEVDTEEPREMMRELGRRAGTAEMPSIDAADREAGFVACSRRSRRCG